MTKKQLLDLRVKDINMKLEWTRNKYRMRWNGEDGLIAIRLHKPGSDIDIKTLTRCSIGSALTFTEAFEAGMDILDSKNAHETVRMVCTNGMIGNEPSGNL